MSLSPDIMQTVLAVGASLFIAAQGTYFKGKDGAAGKDGAVGATGLKGDTGAQGLPGKDGAAGKDGAQGPPGSQILYGVIAPSVSIGLIGDSYLNTATQQLYKKGTDGTWSLQVALSIPDSVDGNKVLTGAVSLGALSLPRNSMAGTTFTALDPGSYSVIRFTSGTPVIQGIKAPSVNADGRKLILINQSGNAMVIQNENVSAGSASYKITIPVGTDITSANTSSVAEFYYELTSQRWIMTNLYSGSTS